MVGPQTFQCEKWSDGTWWVLNAPEGWKFQQDKTKKNWPYLLISPEGSRLWIGTGKDSKLYGYDYSLAPSELTYDQQSTYLSAAQEAGAHEEPDCVCSRNNDCVKIGTKILTKYELGSLVGYVFPARQWGPYYRRGIFSFGPWRIYITFLAENDNFTSWDEACNIIASISFKSATDAT